MPIRKPAVAPDLVKSKHEKIDEEVLLYIQRNHAASDLTLNQKHFGKRFSLPLNLSTEENLACKSLKFVSQSHLSAVNRNHHYATSDLMLCQTAIDKRLSLPVNLDKSVNPPPLCSYPCINDLSICEPTKLIKTERSNYIDSQVSEEFIVDKATEDIQEEVATCLSLQKSVKRGLFYKTFKRVRHILRRMEKCISQIL